jgi:hypothetical protein
MKTSAIGPEHATPMTPKSLVIGDNTRFLCIGHIDKAPICKT